MEVPPPRGQGDAPGSRRVAWLRELIADVPLGMAIISLGGQWVDANGPLCRMLGYTADELRALRTEDFILGTGLRAASEQALRLVSAGGAGYQIEQRVLRKGGGQIDALLSVSLARDADGSPLAFVAHAQDITALRRAERAQRESEARYRTLVEQLPAMMYQANLDSTSTTTYVSPQVEAIFGFTQEEWLADPEFWLRQVHPDDRGAILESLRHAQAANDAYVMEYRCLTRDGRTVWVQDTSRVVRDEAGAPLFLQGIIFDITGQRQVEEQLREREELLRLAYDAADLGVWTHTFATDTLQFDERAQRHFSIGPGDIPLRDLLLRIHPDDTGLLREAIAVSTDPAGDGRFAPEYRVIHADGGVRWLSIQALVHFAGEGARRWPVMAVGTSQDVTERKRIEAQVKAQALRFQRLAEASRAFTVASTAYPTVLELVARTMTELLCDICTVYEVSADRSAMLLREATASDSQISARLISLFPDEIRLDSLPYARTVVQRGEMVVVPTVDRAALRAGSPPEARAIMDLLGPHAVAMVPLMIQGEVVCVLALLRYLGYVEPFAGDDLRLAQDLADRASLALTNARLFAQLQGELAERARAEQEIRALNAVLEERVAERTAALRELLDRTAALYAITEAAIASENSAEALQLALDHAAAAIRADRLLLLVFDERERAIQHFVASGPGAVDMILDVGFDEFMSGLTGWAVRERRPAVSPKGAPDPRESPAAQRRRAQTESGSIVVVPLRHLDQVFGTMTAINRPDQPDFGPADVDLMEAIAGQIAIAHARVRLHERLQHANQLLTERSEALEQAVAGLHTEIAERAALEIQVRQQAARASALAELSQELAEFRPDDRSIFDFIAGRVAALIGDVCLVTILSDDGASLEVVAIGATSPERTAQMRTMFPSPYPSGEGVTGHVLRTGQALLVTQLQDEEAYARIRPEYHPYVAAYGVASLLVVPMRARGRLLGTLGVARDARGRAYTEADQTFLQDAADRAGLAIENARLFVQSQHARVEAERANRFKDEFLANMSHELRTPLTAVLGFAESLREQAYGPLNERQEHAVAMVEDSGRHLLTLINDILDLAKIGAGKVELTFERALVQDVCEASLRIVRQSALKKQIALSVSLDPQVLTVRADTRRLKQILVNLLSNAVKFTPAGGAVSLEVRGDQHAGAVRFVVSDTGIGIAPENLGRLFQPFVQLDSRLSRQFEGTGLGLALVNVLSNMHGGSVAVESEPGRGSRFTLTLPLNGGDQAERGQAASTAPEQAARPRAESRTILLADDNMISSQAVVDYLAAVGYHVVVARGGEEALARAREIRPDLVLMDIQMPGMDGLEAIRSLRADPAFAETPLIAFTALAMPGDRERCLAAGADDYLTKPIGLRVLADAVSAHLGARDPGPR